MRKIASEQAAAQPKKKGIYLVLIIIAAAVLAVSAYMLISYYAGADSEENTYGELTSAHVSMDEQEVEEQIQKMNFKTGISLSDGTYYYDPTLTDYYSVLADRNIGLLQEQYPDIIGWLYIPGTKISYPVMYSEGEEYLYRNFKGEDVKSGSLFMFNTTSLDPRDNNITIHGHDMKSGAMFGSLKAFWLEEEMWTGENILYFDTADGQHKYQIFSIYITGTDDVQSKTSFASDEEYVEYLNQMAQKSHFPAKNVTFSAQDKILTLSTCTRLLSSSGEDRLIIQAKLVE